MSMWRHPLLFIFFLHFRSFMFIWHHPSYSLDFLHFLPFIWFSSFHFQVILFHVAPSSIHLIFFISGHSYSSGAIPSYSLDFLHFRSFMIIWRHPLLFIRFSSFQVIHVHLAPSPPIHWIFFIPGHAWPTGAIPSYSLDFLHFRSFMFIWRHPLLFIGFSSFQVMSLWCHFLPFIWFSSFHF